jgi:hypothetical protein
MLVRLSTQYTLLVNIPKQNTTESDEQSDQNGGKCTSDTSLRLLQHQTHDDGILSSEVYVADGKGQDPTRDVAEYSRLVRLDAFFPRWVTVL